MPYVLALFVISLFPVSLSGIRLTETVNFLPLFYLFISSPRQLTIDNWRFLSFLLLSFIYFLSIVFSDFLCLYSISIHSVSLLRLRHFL